MDSFGSIRGLCFGCLDSFDSFEIGVLGIWALLTVLTVFEGEGEFGVDRFDNIEGCFKCLDFFSVDSFEGLCFAYWIILTVLTFLDSFDSFDYFDNFEMGCSEYWDSLDSFDCFYFY